MMIAKERSITIIGDNPEAILISVLLAERGNPNNLIGTLGSDSGDQRSGRGSEEVARLVQIHTRSGAVKKMSSTDELQPPDLGLCLLTEHADDASNGMRRSEEHTSELQSRPHLVCRLLLERKK